MVICPWASYQIRKIAVCEYAPGVLGTFSPPPPVSDPNMHHGTCVTHVPWCMPGSLTIGFLWSRWQENVSGIPGACTTHNFAYLVRGPSEPSGIHEQKYMVFQFEDAVTQHSLLINQLTHQLCSPHLATHTPAVLTTNGHSHTSCIHTWPFTHQLYSPHMANHTPAVLTTHGHSHISRTHHTWPFIDQLYSPHMADHKPTVSKHGHSHTGFTHHTSWPLTHQPDAPHMAIHHRPAVRTTHGRSYTSCTHHT